MASHRPDKPTSNTMRLLRGVRDSGSLPLLLSLYAIVGTWRVWCRYHEPVFTLLVFSVYGPVLTMTILIHELARAVTKKKVCSLTDNSYYDKVYNEICVVVSGPLTHVLQCLFWLSLYFHINQGDFSHVTVEIDIDKLNEGGALAFVSILALQATVMNVVMLKLSLLIPVYPFAGARILVGLAVLGGASFYTAGAVTACAGVLVGLLLFWVGFFCFLVGHEDVALCLVGLAAFTLFSAVRLLRMTLSGHVTDHVLFRRTCYVQDQSSLNGNVQPLLARIV